MVLLKDNNLKEIISVIVQGGKQIFIDNLAIARVSHEKEPTECFVCHKPVGKSGVAWMLTDHKGAQIFGDRYESDDCADRARRWLQYILEEYMKFLGPEKMVAGGNLTEDDLRDPVFPEDGESLKGFRRRCKARLEHLGELVSEIPEGARTEDHQ